jgi:hypothetical protein
MDTTTDFSNLSLARRYELRFGSLFHEGRGYAFPCDAQGRVDLRTLGERARRNFAWVCAAVGREFSVPAVRPSC